MRRRVLVAIVAVAALTACGSDNDGAVPLERGTTISERGTPPSERGTPRSSEGGAVLQGAPPEALVLGDSNLFESSASVDAAIRVVGFVPTLRGVPGFGLKDLETYWRDELSALLAPDPAVVVVALGTNDTGTRADVDAFPDRLDAMMRAIGDHPVVWVTHVDERPFQVAGGAAAVNAAIRAARARWPNLTVLDRTAALSADPSLLRRDGLHFTAAGAAAFAAEIASAARARVPAASARPG